MNTSFRIATIVPAALCLLLIAAGCSNKDAADDGPPAGDAAIEASQDQKAAGSNRVLIKTNKGDIEIFLNAEKAPVSVENFKAYVREGFYDNTIVHRVENKGMYLMQAGGITQEGTPKKPVLPPIVCESDNGLKNTAGTIGYGRTNVPNSATSHFYINYKDNPGFDHREGFTGYAVFGEVVKGLDVVAKIAGLRQANSALPSETVVIKSASLIEAPEK